MRRGTLRLFALAALLLALAWWLVPYAAPGAPVVSVLFVLTFCGGFVAAVAALGRVFDPEV